MPPWSTRCHSVVTSKSSGIAARRKNLCDTRLETPIVILKRQVEHSAGIDLDAAKGHAAISYSQRHAHGEPRLAELRLACKQREPFRQHPLDTPADRRQVERHQIAQALQFRYKGDRRFRRVPRRLDVCDRTIALRQDARLFQSRRYSAANGPGDLTAVESDLPCGTLKSLLNNALVKHAGCDQLPERERRCVELRVSIANGCLLNLCELVKQRLVGIGAVVRRWRDRRPCRIKDRCGLLYRDRAEGVCDLLAGDQCGRLGGRC
jgi:hypothetical protein